MNREEDPQLWDLLGRSKPVEPSVFFSRNVVRAVRLQQAREESWVFPFLRSGKTLTVCSALLALVITTFGAVSWKTRPPMQPSREISTQGHDADLESDLSLLSSPDEDGEDIAVL